MKAKDLVSVTDFSPETVHQLIENAWELKGGRRFDIPKGRVLALVFEKPSLRTRVSFEMAMIGLGGHSLYLSPSEVGLGKRESISDVARVLSRYVDIIAARTFSHQTVKELAAHCSVPVINALSDYEHPCQALADMLTILEKKGGLKGVKIAYIGDGNNVANSLVLVAAMLGVDVTIAAPHGYHLDENVLNRAREYARLSGSTIDTLEDPHAAVKGADVIYTDTWTSMGQEQESEKRIMDFRGYQVNSNLLCSAPERVIVMHCLPAHRGEEITGDIIDGPHSVVFDQAENRLHAAKAVLVHLLGGLEISIGD